MKFPKIVPAKNFPDYDAMDDGNIRNRKTGRIMKTQTNKKGFKTVSLRDGKKQRNVKVSRVIADSFYEGDHSGLDVCYKDGDKQNTAPDNLIFCTRSESINRAYEFGKKEFRSKVRVRIVETGEAFRSIRACALSFGDENYRIQIAECLDDPNKMFKGFHFISLNR